MNRRFKPEIINPALDSRTVGTEPNMAIEIGISVPTLRKVRKGGAVSPKVIEKVLQWLQTAPEDRRLVEFLKNNL